MNLWYRSSLYVLGIESDEGFQERQGREHRVPRRKSVRTSSFIEPKI